MGFDAILKRYFPVVVCVLIGIAAYFQASGMGQLVAASVAVDPSATPAAPPPPRALPSAAAQNPDHTTSAAAILSRNPFDSVTGPLDGTSIEVPNASAPEPANTDPMADPLCESAKVLLITASEDPAWSFAAIQGGDGKTVLRRQGDEVGGQTVYFISWDRVWLTQGGQRCQMEVGGKVQPKGGPKPAPVPPPGGASGGSGKSGVPQSISSKIHKISDTQFDIERSVVEEILGNQAELMKSARIVPEKEGDKMVGIRLFGIRGDSLLGVLGLENGDRLQSINGFEMTDPQKALEAYARLRTADHLTVAVNRRGKDTNIDFNIK